MGYVAAVTNQMWQTTKSFTPAMDRMPVSMSYTTPKTHMRPWVFVVLAIAGGIWAWSAYRPSHKGPWCVWARPLGTNGAATAGNGGSWGDARTTPAGTVADGSWTSTGRIVSAGSWTPILSHVERPILAWIRAETGSNYVVTDVRQELGADTWTAFVAEVRPGDLSRAAPDRHAAGTWTLTADGVDRTLILNDDGTVRDAGKGTAWAVSDGALVIDIPDSAAPGGASITVGILGADGWSFTGRDAKGRTVTGRWLER